MGKKISNKTFRALKKGDKIEQKVYAFGVKILEIEDIKELPYDSTLRKFKFKNVPESCKGYWALDKDDITKVF